MPDQTIIDVPLPGMPDYGPALWAVHVQGPDDILASESRQHAEETAAGLNAWYEAQTRKPDFDPEVYPRIHGEVIAWPYDAAAHADSLKRQAEEQ